jgi:hypothetical protein
MVRRSSGQLNTVDFAQQIDNRTVRRWPDVEKGISADTARVGQKESV